MKVVSHLILNQITDFTCFGHINYSDNKNIVASHLEVEQLIEPRRLAALSPL